MAFDKIRNQVDDTLDQWRKHEIMALELLRVSGELRFNRSIELVLFRKGIYDTKPSRLLQLHQYSKNYSEYTLSIEDTLSIAKSIADLSQLPACKIDIGKIGLEWLLESSNGQRNLTTFLKEHLDEIIGQEQKNKNQKDIVLYGFGRIGRLAARRIIETTGKGDQLRLKAIVIRPKLKDRNIEAEKRAALLATDSVHGDFGGTVHINDNGNELIINGNRIKIIYANSPDEINYQNYGIKDALLIDNTGVWRDDEGLNKHLRPGIGMVMLTAPAKGNIPNIVYGVNHSDFQFETLKVISAASCTTNAIAPVLQLLHDNYNIKKGHIETVHAYTNDQNLLDNFHKKPRRGRGAPVNLVLTSTGAASAVAKVIPSLSGKLSGNAIRVPTPNVSLAILNLTIEKKTDVSNLNHLLQEASLYGPLVEQLRYSNSTEFVSSNAIGSSGTCIIDAPSTIVSTDGHSITVYLWYDNEYGYTCQVVRLAKHVSNVRRHSYY